ncbi:MAG: tetratricopeptide repeat protein, partial [Candidatus Omnitrophota bacterium]|nr:tetratricopeptide repeat protein [Candidatus Omnitrophota bacterium]
MTNFKLKFLKIILLLIFITNYELRTTNYELLAQEPSKEEETLFVAKKAFEDGFYDVALGLFGRFLKNYPSSSKIPEVNLLTGECYFRQNRFLDALAKFEELQGQGAAQNIKDAILYWVAEVHFKGNNFTKASQYYKAIIEGFPKSSYCLYAYYSLGWCLFQEAKFDEAIKYFKIVEEKFPKEPQAQDSSFKIIECLYNLKDYSGLKDSLKSYLKLYSKDTAHVPYLYFYMAEADYYLTNFQEAIDEYSKVITSSGDERIQGLSKLGIGWAYLKLKRYKESGDTFSEIKTDNLDKKNRDILLLGKATLSLETKSFTEAGNLYGELANTTLDQVILIQAYLGKADAYYNTAEYKKAISVYEEALNKTSESASQENVDKLHYGLAWAFLKEGEFKKAIDEFQKIAKHTEDKIVKVAALCQIGDAYQDLGDYNKAIETYDSILKNYPDSLYSDYIQYQLGITLLKTSNYDGAIMAFQSLKNHFPDSKLLDDATYALGLAYFQRQDYKSSKEIFEKFQDEFKDSNLKPESLYLLGTSLYNLGDFAKALEVFKNIIRMYNQNTELIQKAEYEIADCYYQMGNEKEAMERFKILRSKYPDSKLTPEVMWWLAEYYYRHNELSLARRYFSSLIQDFPKNNLIPDAYYALGSTYAEENKNEEAIDNFKKVIELGKSDLAGTASIAIADIYTKQDKIDLSLGIYKDVVSEYPNLASLIYPKIADLYRKISNYGEAINFYRKSLNIVPAREMVDIQFKIAEALQSEGSYPEAIEEYLKVTYLYSENNDLAVKALLRVAAIYEDKENFKEATNIYKRINSMNVQEAKYAQERIDWIRAH